MRRLLGRHHIIDAASARFNGCALCVFQQAPKEWLSFPDESVLTTDPEMAAELTAMSKGNFFDRMLQAV
jgi:hypothetical protein